jgi:glutamate dehydrogenase
MATTYVQRLTSLMPAGKKNALESQFVQIIGRQIRAPYPTRHPPANVIEQLKELYALLQRQKGDELLVEGEAIDGGIAIMSVMPDQPFIIDTLRHALKSAGAEYVVTLNAVLGVARDGRGRITRFDHPHDPIMSVVRAEAEGIDTAQLPAVLQRVEHALGLAQGMVADFDAITDLVEQAADRFASKADRLGTRGEDYREIAAFLRWLVADNFVFMAAEGDGSSLGFARLGEWSHEDDGGEPGVDVRKSALESPVHRAGRLDEIRVRVPDDDGETAAVFSLLGMFTRRGVTQPSRHVPLLRRSLAWILKNQDSKPGSFRYKNIANLFDSLPTELLFTTPREEIGQMIEQMLEAEHEQRASVHVTQSEEGDVTFVLTAMPKEHWSDSLREDIEQVVRAATGASYADNGVFVNRHDTVLQHFFLTGTRLLSDKDIDKLEERVGEMATSWEDRILEALTEKVGKKRADELIDRYGNAFDETYQAGAQTAETLRDLEALDQLGDDRPIVVDLFQDQTNDRVHLRIYHTTELLLSDVLPILDNFGLIIIDQWSHVVRPAGASERRIQTFRLQGVWGLEATDILARETLLIDGLSAVFAKRVNDDVLNRILLRANVPWQAVDLFRAYIGYARQLGLRFTLNAIQEILLAQPHLVSLLWEYFQARFDPDLDGKRDSAIERSREAFEDQVRGVPDHDQDVAFRTLFNLVDSTLRTNFYRTDRKGYYVSFKIDCKSVRMMPTPRMMYEIYVHHREMDGLHLRGGPIARGGLRWSDREDFRREILDLVTTQMVKNVLIVPEGAKGGFYIKKPIRDPKERRRYADTIYQTFIRALLDVTDNIVNGKVVPPPRVVRHDGDDPYLVVAADKGTAHLSDTANSISKEYGFWLGDAFASGGSHGYDHKECGITARGGWVTAKRHFLEMGVNPYEQVFTCVGIGDPSGDVFGNGVIETPKMKLLAAFNHLHVFLDPNPDPQTSYEERLRLFKEVKGWDQYNQDLISTGGGIFDRRAKSIALTPELKQMLQVLQDELPVDAVIRLILRMQVDLLWNGGIGTYVKASTQTHLDAGDPTNDQLRVNASDLRCKVVGEGGNLGFTQAARLEYALNGGRINTDAIDNSGGVDMSDHEVNLKILLNPIVHRKEISEAKRNELLEAWTDEVVHFVLANNDAHARQLSLDQVRSALDPMSYSPVVDYATRMSGRARTELQLPTEDTLQRRAAARQGITRPELAVLNGHVKMHVFKAMMNDTSGETIEGFDEWVVNYFPTAVRKRWPDDIQNHMLHRAIGMTVILTHVMADAGVKVFPMLMDLTAASPVAIANTWLRISEHIGLEHLRKQINGSEAALEHQYRSWTWVTDGIAALTALSLSPGERPTTDEDIERMNDVLTKLPRLWGSTADEAFLARIERYERRKMPATVAHRTALLGHLAMAWEIARLPFDEDSVSQAIIQYVAVGEASRILPALRRIEARQCQGPWDPVAMGILRYRYALLLRELVQAVDVGQHVRLGVDRLAQRLGRGQLRDIQVEMDRILGTQPDLATLLVAQERVRALVARQTSPKKRPGKVARAKAAMTSKRSRSKKAANGSARVPAK